MRGPTLALAAVGFVALIVALAPGAAAEHGCGSPANPDAIAGTSNEDGDGLPLVGVCVGHNDTGFRGHAGEDYDQAAWGWYQDEDAGAWVQVIVNRDANVTRVDGADASLACDTNPNTPDPNPNERCQYIAGDATVDTDGENSIDADFALFVNPRARSGAAAFSFNVDENVLPEPQVRLP